MQYAICPTGSSSPIGCEELGIWNVMSWWCHLWSIGCEGLAGLAMLRLLRGCVSSSRLETASTLWKACGSKQQSSISFGAIWHWTRGAGFWAGALTVTCFHNALLFLGRKMARSCCLCLLLSLLSCSLVNFLRCLHHLVICTCLQNLLMPPCTSLLALL